MVKLKGASLQIWREKTIHSCSSHQSLEMLDQCLVALGDLCSSQCSCVLSYTVAKRRPFLCTVFLAYRHWSTWYCENLGSSQLYKHDLPNVVPFLLFPTFYILTQQRNCTSKIFSSREYFNSAMKYREKRRDRTLSKEHPWISAQRLQEIQCGHE